MNNVRIGTRSSPLALKQAHLVAEALQAHHPDLNIDIVHMTTTGDLIENQRLVEWGGKGLFTKEIEEALLQNRIDLAVHSMKDVATVLPDGLVIPAYLEREDPRDIWLSHGGKTLEELSSGARVGTSSLRRQAQVLALRPDAQVVTLRGNVNTRLKKLAEGHAEATLLAAAGLRRLGITPEFAVPLPLDTFIPAVAQGVIGLQCRKDDPRMLALIAPLNHQPTATVVTIERAFLAAVDGSCRTPIAAHATLEERGSVTLRAFVATPDGQYVERRIDQCPLTDALTMAQKWGEEMRAWLAAHTRMCS